MLFGNVKHNYQGRASSPRPIFLHLNIFGDGTLETRLEVASWPSLPSPYDIEDIRHIEIRRGVYLEGVCGHRV